MASKNLNMSAEDVLETQKALGLSINEMASLMGSGRSTWNKWARGERKINKAAATLLRRMVWLHENEPVVMEKMLAHEAGDQQTKRG